MIQPLFHIAIREKIQTDHGNQIRHRPAVLRHRLQHLERQHADQCCPNPDQQRILTCPNEGIDFKMLFQRFKEYLDLPAIPINPRDRRCAQSPVVRQNRYDLSALRIDRFDHAKRRLSKTLGVGAVKRKVHIAENVAVLRHGKLCGDDPVMPSFKRVTNQIDRFSRSRNRRKSR